MKKKILIIDDERDFSNAIKDHLEFQGYTVALAFDGQAGHDTAVKIRPDLILMDIMMPKINGFRLCRLLKSNKVFKNTPIVMLTARNHHTDIEQGREVDADGYLVKPLSKKLLMKAVQKHAPHTG